MVRLASGEARHRSLGPDQGLGNGGRHHGVGAVRLFTIVRDVPQEDCQRPWFGLCWLSFGGGANGCGFVNCGAPYDCPW